MENTIEIFEKYYIKLTHTQKGESLVFDREFKCNTLARNARIQYLNHIENIIIRKNLTI